MILPMILAVTVTLVNSEGHSVNSVECRAGHVEREGESAWLWRPADRAEILQCSGDEFEPIDLAQEKKEPPNDTYVLKLARSRKVTADGSTGISLVEWRKPTPEGLVILATRSVRGEHDLVLNVANEPRVLSFVWDDGRRTSTCVPPETTALQVERPEKGSEFAVWLGMRQIRPSQIRLRTADAMKVATLDRCGFVSISGLAESLYSAEAVYKSGIAVGLPRVKITDGFYQLPSTSFPAAGAVFVEGGQEYCTGLSQQPAVAVSAAPTRDEEHAVGRVALDTQSCTALLDGLAPGDYRISAALDGGNGTFPAGRVTVRADRMEDLPIRIDLPRVDGVVLLGDRPISDVLVYFRGEGIQETGSTDRDGRFSVVLEKPGHYEVDVRTAPWVPGELKKEVEVRKGRQELRLALPAGRIVISARPSTGKFDGPIEINLQRGSDVRTAVALPDKFRAEFVGLPTGKYSITASGRPGWITSHATEIEIDPDVPDREVEIYLEKRNARTLTVHTEAGEPVGGAYVTVGGLVIPEVSPGTFEIRADAGYRMSISAQGYLPVCRDLGEWEEGVDVVLRHGPFSATIRLGPQSRDTLGGILGLPESTCAVYVLSLPNDVSKDGDTTVVRLNGLPAGHYAYVDPTGRTVPMDVPGEAITLP